MKTTRILIWGKSYPDLTTASTEVLFAGGCTEKGKVIRLHPIPLRYVPNHLSYHVFDWIEAPIARSRQDYRPECYNIMSKDIQRVGRLYPNKGWSRRDRFIEANASWHYPCLTALEEAQKKTKASLGFIKVGAIDSVWSLPKTEKEKAAHEYHLDILKNQNRLSEEVEKQLSFLPFRIFVQWRCQGLSGHQDCAGHTAEVTDENIERVARKTGVEKAIQRIQHYADVKQFDLAFFMANTKTTPENFSIVGLWYPSRQEVINLKAQLSLF